MSQTVNPSVILSLLARIYCKETLVWYEAFDFYNPINARPFIGLLLDILLLSHVVEILLGSSGQVPLHPSLDHK